MGPLHLAPLVCLLLAIVASACSRPESQAVPAKLVDGSPAPAFAVELEGVDAPALLTDVRVVDPAVARRDSAVASCVSVFAPATPSAVAVARAGVDTASVTFRNVSGTAVSGCVDSAGRRAEGRRWCGVVHGTLRSGLLTDPRLDIGCVAPGGARIATAWIQPGLGTTYVVVSGKGYAEVYRAAADLPIRIGSSSDVDVEGARARFEISEHAADGRRLRGYALEAVVAG